MGVLIPQPSPQWSRWSLPGTGGLCQPTALHCGTSPRPCCPPAHTGSPAAPASGAAPSASSLPVPLAVPLPARVCFPRRPLHLSMSSGPLTDSVHVVRHMCYPWSVAHGQAQPNVEAASWEPEPGSTQQWAAADCGPGGREGEVGSSTGEAGAGQRRAAGGTSVLEHPGSQPLPPLRPHSVRELCQELLFLELKMG